MVGIGQDPRVLIWDAEATPWKALLYGTVYDPKVVDILEHQRLLCFAYKWLGDKDISIEWAGTRSDKQAVQKLKRLFDEAHIILAYNGKRFDTRFAQMRFEYYGLGPASHFQQIDPLLVHRKYFMLPSNKMDDVAAFHGLPRKLDKDSGLFHKAASGDKKARKELAAYNIRDVEVLEAIYIKTRAWDEQHPNMGHYDVAPVCRVCRSENLGRQGRRPTRSYIRIQWKCRDCGAFSSTRTSLPQKSVLT